MIFAKLKLFAAPADERPNKTPLNKTNSTDEQKRADDEARMKIELKSLQNKVDLLERENHSLKRGLGHIQENLADSVKNSNNALENLQEIDLSFTSIDSESEEILQNISTLKNIVEQTSGSSQEIEEGVSSIMEAVKGIAVIARQSKLLSFNASVEAARAGEHGKGFAVVAEEVQNLSNSTSQLLRQIEEKIETFGNISKSLAESAKKSLETSTHINEKFDDFNRHISKTVGKNRETVMEISATNDEVFMSLAKLDHVIWKINTYISVLAQEPSFSFVDHFNCRLGKWYYQGEGKKSFSNLSSYGALEGCHAKVHDGTRKIFDYLSDADANMDSIAEGAEEMERASEEVFEALDQMLEEKKRRR